MIESMWNGFRRIDFMFEGREAILVFPNEANAKKNWLLKTEYFDIFPQLEIDMVARGWHLAYIKNVTRWCLEEDLDLKQRFCVYLSKEYGLSPKCVPVGMSCGGLIGSKLAAKYPECIAALYLDAPVLNLLSCPGGFGRAGTPFWDEFTQATGMDRIQLMCYREHPIDKMSALLRHNIPIVLVYGTDDDIVPFEENGQILERYYRENGGTMLAIGKEGCGHHPHGPEDTAPVVAFLEEHCN